MSSLNSKARNVLLSMLVQKNNFGGAKENKTSTNQ